VAAWLAAAPLLAVLLTMLLLRWSAARAGLAGLLIAALTVETPSLALFAGALAEGGFHALAIVAILWPALALHAQQERGGALQRLRERLAARAAAPALQALLLGWCVALFFEGAAGFGTPVALVAPLLVGLGLAPLQAVLLALVGHALGVCFGALGTPVAALAAVSGLEATLIARPTALLQLLLAPLLMLAFAALLRGAGMALPWRALLLAGLGFALPSFALAWWLGPSLATLLGALCSAGLLLPLLRGGTASAAAAGWAGALWPYALLTLLVLAARAWPEAAALRLHWQWQGFGAQLAVHSHPGLLLALATLLAARLQRLPTGLQREAWAAAGRQLLPVAAALLIMLVLSRLLLHGQQLALLQRAAVDGLGAAWPLLAPTLGALGSFVTGSATASNLLFGGLQLQTASALGLDGARLLAAQGLGAGLGNLICPHNLIAGAATVGLRGAEGALLRRTLPICGLGLLLCGIVVWRWA
jgi:lactate permease